MRKKSRSLVLVILCLLVCTFPARRGAVSVHAASKKEYRAFWFSYYDFETYRKKTRVNNRTTFSNYFTKVIKRGKSLGMNTIIVHVRPFSDAIYRSRYYPWSACISGRQGRSPGYDPLEIMVKTAHDHDMRIEAWINPYRVTIGSVNYKALSKKNPARKWHYTKGKKRTVLAYGGSLYYNPSRPAVRNLIVKGAVEIVRNYQVDGIHMDDYFYPSFSRGNVKSAFDAREYRKSPERRRGKSIASYRRKQVNLLVRQLRKAIKKADPDCTFGISPAGQLSSLRSSCSYYVDVDTWVKSSRYVDYICPQIYWGFHHPQARFDRVTRQWIRLTRHSPVKLYIGIAVYKVGTNRGLGRAEKREWKKDASVLKKEVQYARRKGADGFAFFDYEDLVRKSSQKAVKKLRTVLR